MALTTTTALKNWNPVRNPVLLRMATDASVDVAEVLSSFELEFDETDMPGAGDTIAMQQWDGTGWVTQYTITITAAGTADGTKLQANEYTSGTVDDWVAGELIPVLQLDYTLGTHYTFTAALDFLIATANSANAPIWRAIETGFVPLSSGQTSGTSEVLQASFGLLFQLWVETEMLGGTYALRLEEKYPVDDGTALFNPAEVLRAYLTPNTPAANMTTAVEMDGCMRRFYVRVVEEYGSPLVQYDIATTPVRFAHLAGRTEPARVATPEWRTYLQPSVGAHKFLTTWPNVNWDAAKLVRPEQREFLAYIEPALGGIDTIRLMADIYYTDGTSSLADELEQVTFEAAGRPLLFAVGIEARNLNASKTVDRMRVWLRAVGTGLDVRLTEYRYFRVDHRPAPNFRQLHYFNSWGGWDTIALTGERTTGVQVQRLTSRRDTTEPADMDGVRDTETVLQAIDQGHEVGTVYLHQDELPALKELLASERIVERVGSEHWPVASLDDRATLVDEREGLAAFVVNYRHAFRNTAG